MTLAVYVLNSSNKIYLCMTLLCCAHKMISPNLAVWPAEKLTRRLLEIFRSRISMAFSLQPHLSCFSKMCHKYLSYFSLVEVRKPKKATLLSVLKILTPKGSYSTFRVDNSTMKGIMESGQDLLCFFPLSMVIRLCFI